MKTAVNEIVNIWSNTNVQKQIEFKLLCDDINVTTFKTLVQRALNFILHKVFTDCQAKSDVKIDVVRERESKIIRIGLTASHLLGFQLDQDDVRNIN